MTETETFFKIIVADFEFGMLDRETYVLVSAGFSDINERNAQGRRFVVKLNGRPILLEKGRNLDLIPPYLTDDQIREFVEFQKRIFKSKPKILDPLMKELRLGLECPEKPLTYMNIWYEIVGTWTVIVTWNGETDLTILKLMGFYQTYCLSLSCNDLQSENNFHLSLVDLYNKHRPPILDTFVLHNTTKRGRLMNLEETHSKLCGKGHGTTHAHDPKTDVIFTTCLFQLLLKKENCSLEEFYRILKSHLSPHRLYFNTS